MSYGVVNRMVSRMMAHSTVMVVDGSERRSGEHDYQEGSDNKLLHGKNPSTMSARTEGM
jgi:hypothetical protein